MCASKHDAPTPVSIAVPTHFHTAAAGKAAASPLWRPLSSHPQGSNATTVAMQAAMWVKDPQILEDFRRFCIVYPFSILHILKSEKELAPIAAALLYPQELEVYRGSRKGRQVRASGRGGGGTGRGQLCLHHGSGRAGRLMRVTALPCHPPHCQAPESAAATAAAPQVVITKLRQLHTDAGLATAQFLAMDTAIQATWKAAGDALRIRFQAMPHGLSLVW